MWGNQLRVKSDWCDAGAGGKFMAWGAQQMAAVSQAMNATPPRRAFPAYILSPMS